MLFGVCRERERNDKWGVTFTVFFSAKKGQPGLILKVCTIKIETIPFSQCSLVCAIVTTLSRSRCLAGYRQALTLMAKTMRL